MTDKPRYDQSLPSNHYEPTGGGGGGATGDTGRETPGSWEETSVYSPTPEPRADWSRPSSSWSEPTPSDRVAWSQPTARPETVAVAPRGTRSSPLGQVILAAILAGVLGSGGTFLALNASGALDRHTPIPAATTTGTTVGAKQPVTLDESSAIIDVAAKVTPAVVRITVDGTSTDSIGDTIPTTGVGSGVIYDSSGWILTNKHVVTNSSGTVVSKLSVELKDGRRFDGTVYGVDTLTDLAIVKIEAADLPAASI